MVDCIERGIHTSDYSKVALGDRPSIVKTHLYRHFLGIRLKFERLNKDEDGGETGHGTKRKQRNDSKFLAFWEMKLANFNGRENENGAVDQNMRQDSREEERRFADMTFCFLLFLRSIPHYCDGQTLQCYHEQS